MNRFAIAESLIGGLVTVMTPVSLAYVFCLWSGRTVPKIDHRAVASTWSFCSKLREAKIFIPITSLRSKSSKHTVPTASILPENIAVRPTASLKAKPSWLNPFYRAPKLPPGQVCALVVIMIICFAALVWLFVLLTRRPTVNGQFDGQSENCDTLDETHKQIGTKFDSLSSSIESLNERQEKESIPKKQEKASAAEKQKRHKSSSGFEKDDQQLGKLIKKFETQGQQMQFQFRFSDTGSLEYESTPGSFSTRNDRIRSESPQFIFQAGRATEQNVKQRETFPEEERRDV
ncbi:uncharacterized protein APUU_70760S [Aspergillus puulaauensis]|uniref:Uncharacterized protein n=1 Tax=Aspergillus puulaauensis TaxID=1220207 RepID=A0A7R7XYX9_9EURO|nr:uncharacterized protein APUU_70760S [Aspergillus puulaauensis]BCS29189.1 hypothetical protein APUU_70760S [Aspergillus puulaauensis]